MTVASSQIVENVLQNLPPLLRQQAEAHWQCYVETAGDDIAVNTPELLEQTLRVWGCSDFVAQSCVRFPDLLEGLLAGGELSSSRGEGDCAALLAEQLVDVSDEASLQKALRLFRRREMVRIAWRDLSGKAELVESTADLSALADACLDLTLSKLYGWHCEQWGTPCNVDGEPQQLVVLGMGKLGAHELNYSSDIDLIFAYPEDGETRDGRRSLTNQEFFIRLGQRLIQALDNNTADGFVFRVDMRLRPFGESSAMAISFDAMETYYQSHGREWERYAMVKARVVAGDQSAGEGLMAMLKPFVYRRYVDFGAFESLREMKAMIAREVQRKEMHDNVKLGAGGIREVEFIGQAFQLIRGGREPLLQQRRILQVLAALSELELLPEYVVTELVESYVFLRDTEHCIQMFADQQTHDLPKDEEGRCRLAFAMRHTDWESFESVLRGHMQRVHQHFEQVFAAPQEEHAASDERDFTGLWLGSQSEEQSVATLTEAGFEGADEILRRLQQIRASRNYQNLSAQGRERLDRLIPLLLGAVCTTEAPATTLMRVLLLIEAVTRRSSYLALLFENPMALSQLVRLCAASSWISSLLVQHPVLLDELLDPRTLYHPPDRKALEQELRQMLSHIPPEDQEQAMDAMRQFKQVNILRVAAADVSDVMPLMVVSDHLTNIAEVLLDEALTLAWNYLVARHGRPWCGDEHLCETGFAVIAYGKMGGLELGYGSDLDLVFLHSSDSEGRGTNGDKPVDNAVFYARLAQRTLHILGARTSAGVLYEVDMRLRPSGASGLMVSSVQAFADYEHKQAWTWEHQALVRARMVAGDPAIASQFDAIRREVLGQSRDKDALRKEVQEMRER
ncbi:MAG: bifunctional [glutamate--ammonia ligase]-adenylyl-L-tyrosine phosphorylase/[glutamate--ammonia-ligase] adenylyltransferase, partial [Gammaproteobacteria bacterium]|nr:bifunctional [glutamate--ammonia ligase]-adenylyl-L-tyrosine phosphorylase/[glutamate--ammonia-ligase] adenylyltransferase [Gammaproteobacteria bacterium]